jgi:primosomal protein N' (replication factor Y)
MTQARQQKQLRGEFSEEMIRALKVNWEAGKQSIVFQNRRGYSPYVICEDCDWTGRCHQCDVSLTYHSAARELRCHYCGHHEPLPRSCPACGSFKVRTRGFGTEKVEEELQNLLPGARIGRMDLDTTRTKNALQALIGEVESGALDILVGTQMIAKGLDFDKVSLVCIFEADRMIYFPDFRASERAFQLLTQVSGRAGRRHEAGQVLIQTSRMNHPLLQRLINNDYQGFFEEEISERQSFRYPPFTRMIRLTIKHLEQEKAATAARILAHRLAERLSTERVLGPQAPLVERIRNYFQIEILIKLERELNLSAVKTFLQEEINQLLTDKTYPNVYLVVDVDCL